MANEKRLIDGNGRYTLHASDNTDYSLLFRNGIICVENELGHCVCEFYADDAPTVDAVEVVRCKDCIHYVNLLGGGSDYRCSIFCGCYERPYPTNADDFCSYGERREEE